MAQLVPQWFSTYRRSKSPAIVQSVRLHVSLVFSRLWNPEEVGSNASEEMNLAIENESKLPSSTSVTEAASKKAWPR